MVTDHDLPTVLVLAVMVHVPPPFAVTTPSWLTVATEALEVVQVNDDGSMGQ